VCAIEANHVHNLPRLLVDYDSKYLQYYWNVERIQFIRESKEAGQSLQWFEEPWEELKQYIENQ
jgi:hypothetical protein